MDFPHSDEDRPKIPWSTAIRTAVTSSSAPGPPTMSAQQPKPRTKTSQKLAAKLGRWNESSSEEHRSQSAEEKELDGRGTKRQHNGTVSKQDNEDVDNWNPMSEDFQSPSFNSYTGGPGMLLQSNRSEEENICLFVGNIPTTITKEGIRNLFSRAGDVRRVNLVRSNKSQLANNYGFVEYRTIREAEQALQRLHGFDMGNNVCLNVKIAERQEDRQRRLAKKREDEAFLSTLHCGKYGSEDHTSLEEYEMDEQEVEKALKNPLLPRYNNPPQSDISQSFACDHTTTSPGPSSLASSGGAASLSATPGTYTDGTSLGTSAQEKYNVSSSPSSDVQQTSSPEKQQFACTVCQRLTSAKCSRCKAPYCSEKCQKQDWSQHKLTCLLPGTWNTKREVTEPAIVSNGERQGIHGDLSEPLKIAEDSDDEGFHISIPDNDDIAAIKDFVQQVRSGDAPLRVSQVTQKEESPTTDDQMSQSLTPRQSREPDGRDEVQASSPTKHVTFGPPQQQAYSSNPESGVVVSVLEVVSHFVSPARPLLSIPLESPLPDEFNAVVTSAISCTRFSVVVLSVETKQALVKLQTFGEQGPFLPVKPAELTIGSKCGFKDESDSFYRMEVVRKPQCGSIAVKRYDLGGHMMVSVRSLFCLPEDILLIPCLRHRCSLLNLFSGDGIGVELLMRLVGAKPVHVQYHGTKHMTSNVHEKFLLCKVQSVDGEVNIYEMLQSSQVVRRKDGTKLTQDPQASSLSGLGGAAHDQQHIPEVDDGPGSKEQPYRIVHFAHKIPIHQPPREGVFEIIPTSVTSPSVIWAHVAHPNLGVLHRMEKDLNVHHRSSKGDSYAPTVGEICAAKFANDQQFYRVEVLCVNNNGTVDVLYVDFGNRATVTTGQLRYLQPIFLTLPKQAVQFSLADITPSGTARYWSDNAVAYLKGKITSKNVRVEIVSETQKAFLVRMFDPDSPKQVLNDTMVSLGHAQYVHTGMGKPPTTPPFSLRGVSVGSAQKKTSPRGSTSNVKQSSPLLPHSAMTNSALVQDLPGTHPEAEKQHYQEEPGAANTSVFGQAATFFTESEPITPPLSPIEVPLQDEFTSWKGSSPAEDMGHSPQWSALLKKDTLPATCKHVEHGSHGPPTPTALGQPGQADGSHGRRPPWRAAKQQSSDGEVGAAEMNRSPFARTPDNPHGQPAQTKQPGGNVPWVGVTGGRMAMSVCSEEAANVPDSSAGFQSRDQGPRSPQKHESGNRNETLSLTRKRIETAQLPSNNEPVHALVSHVESPLEFWVQVADHKSIKCLMSIQKELNSAPVAPYTNPKAGELVVCRYSEDNYLYRGRVVSVENKHLKVQFVDYGNTEVIQLSEIYHIQSDFLDLPAQAICCTLNQLLNPAGKHSPWRKEDVEFFKSQVMGDDVVVNVKLVRSIGMKNIVEVAMETESGERDILEMMVGSGHGGSVKMSFKMAGGGRGGNNMQQRSPLGSNFKSRPEQPRSALEGGGLKQQREQPSKSVNRGDTPGGSGQRQVCKVPFASFRSLPDATSPSLTTDQVQAKPRYLFATQRTGGAGTNGSQPEDKLPNPLSGEVSTLQQQQHQYPQVAKMERYRIPNESEYFGVLVTEVENPQSMFVQVASKAFALGLEELMQSLRAHFESAPLPSISQVPEEGSLCCAKFSQDGVWYRAEIIEVFEMECKVRFIDFGNIDSVKLCDLAPCPSQLQITPIMTVHCALNGIAPPKPGSTWSPEATSLLKWKCSDQVLQARVVDSVRGFPRIELVDTSSEVDVSITEELLKGGHAVTTVSAAKAASGELSQATAQLTLSAVQAQESERASNKSARVVIPRARLPQGKVFKVHVTDVTNPWWFCVQEVDHDNLTALNSLMKELQKAYLEPSQHGGFEVQVGAPCCAQYAVDECWYRCQVLEEVGGNHVKLCYVDFGNVGCVSLTKVYPLNTKFTQLPILGVPCSLNAIKPVSQTGWSSEAVQKFKSLVSGDSGDIKFLMAQVVSESVSGATLIELFSDDSGVNSVADVLVQGQYAIPVGSSPTTAYPLSDPVGNSLTETQLPSGQVSTSEAATKASQPPSNRTSLQLTSHQSPLASLPCVVLPSSPEFTVLLTHADSPSSFYIVKVQSIDSMMVLMRNLNSYCPSAKGFQQPPSQGEFCAASYQEEWYRAQVLKQLSQDTFKVFFFDFGNRETVSLNMMRPLLSEHLSLPTQAVKCGLYGVPAREAVSPTAAVMDAFKSLVSNNTFSCKILSTYPLLVSLKDTATTTALSVRDELTQMGLFPQVQDLGLTSLTPSCLPSTDTSVVIVTEITDPSDFWIQVGDRTALSELQKMSQKLNEYCASCSPVRELPVLGQLCCAKFSQDGVWYRARVIEFVTKMSFRVHFVDYGNLEVVGGSDIRPFKSDFMRIPAQAIHCSLVGCEKMMGGAGGGSREVAEHFKELVENRQLIGIHRGTCGVDKTTVELVDTNGDTDVYIHLKLEDHY